MATDSRNSHLANRFLGDGWGWLDPDKPKRRVSIDEKLHCKDCHVPAYAAYATSWTNVQRHPSPIG
jgi:hypothetical protein